MTTITTKKPETLSRMKARVTELEKQLSECLEDRKPDPRKERETLEDSGVKVAPLRRSQRACLQKLVSEILASSYAFKPYDEYNLAKHFIARATRGIRSETATKNICIHFYRLLYRRANALHARALKYINSPQARTQKGSTFFRNANAAVEGMMNATTLILTVYVSFVGTCAGMNRLTARKSHLIKLVQSYEK
jgi:hypothetical protein